MAGLGRRALIYYDGEESSISAAIAAAGRRRDRGHDKRALARSIEKIYGQNVPTVEPVLRRIMAMTADDGIRLRAEHLITEGGTGGR